MEQVGANPESARDSLQAQNQRGRAPKGHILDSTLGTSVAAKDKMAGVGCKQKLVSVGNIGMPP